MSGKSKVFNIEPSDAPTQPPPAGGGAGAAPVKTGAHLPPPENLNLTALLRLSPRRMGASAGA